MTKRRRRGSNRDDIAMGYRIAALPPGGVPRAVVYRTLIDAIADGSGELPPGWDVQWHWRNSPTQDLRTGDLADVVRESRGGFINLMLRRLERDSGQTAQIREATPAEIEAIERAEQETADRARDQKPGEATRRRVRAVFARRSAAAVKGWKTRRRKARAAAAAAKRRSLAAKRAWQTRRRRKGSRR